MTPGGAETACADAWGHLGLPRTPAWRGTAAGREWKGTKLEDTVPARIAPNMLDTQSSQCNSLASSAAKREHHAQFMAPEHVP